MSKYRNPALTVDIIIEKDSEIVLIKRKNDPFKGSWAIPGGFVTIAYTASIKEGFLKADDDACDAEFISIDKLSSISLAFDHNLILSDAMKYL